ncbi:MAG: hypothetical protein JWN49_344 [Parcubacteria group bacterium]|nr:hypothetical protein [Parcubacteria group bacterium]
MELKLSDIIARLKVPGLKESNERHVIAKALSESLGILIAPKQIMFKEGILSVAVPPVVKSALHIKQTEILERIAREGITVQSIR